MINNSILKASLEAKLAMGDQVKDNSNIVINNLVNTYDHNYTSAQDVIDNHNVDNRDFEFHDRAMEIESTKLAAILKACIVTWNSEVKPLAQSLLTKISDESCETLITEVVDTLSIKDIVHDVTFEDMLNIDKFASPVLEETLYNLSVDLNEEILEYTDENIARLTTMLVESKCAKPSAIEEYLIEMPGNLIVDTWNEVFIKRNVSRFLPLDFNVTGIDYLSKVVYGDNNFDKLVLTIMFANYLAESPSENIKVDLAKYEKYFNTLVNATCSQAGVWLKTIGTYIKTGVISPYSYVTNGVTHICLNENLLADLPDTDNDIVSLIMAISSIKNGGTVSREDLADAETIGNANRRIEAVIRHRNAEIELSKVKALDETIKNDAYLNNLIEYTPEIARELSEYEKVYQKILLWIAISRYQNTYVDTLIRRYITLSDVNIDLNILNGKAITHLAAYIVTH